jgi:hypothetical protein
VDKSGIPRPRCNDFRCELFGCICCREQFPKSQGLGAAACPLSNAIEGDIRDMSEKGHFFQGAEAIAARDDEGLGGAEFGRIEVERAKLKERLEDGLVPKLAKLFSEDAGAGLRSRYKEAHTPSASAFQPSTCSWFETAFGLLTMRPCYINGLTLMVSLSNHEFVAVRQAHREAMSDITASATC